MKPRHSIIIITYNQENLISRALDSLLCQKEFIYEIIVADDCSPDNTWKVIQEFQQKYPGLIKPYRNTKNLGIFGNIESTWTKANGDIIWYLAGDDIYCNGVFEEADELIKKNNIDFVNDAFTLYFDYKAISPNGKETINKNNLVERHNATSLKIRQLISNRTTGFSKKIFRKFYPVRKDIGIYADGLIDIQVQFFSEKNYYSPIVGSCYFTNIGIASRTKSDSALRSQILYVEQLKTEIKCLSKNDENWLNYLHSQFSYKLNGSLKNYLTYFILFFQIIKDFYGWSFLKREVNHIFKDTIRLLIPIYIKKRK